MLKSATFLGLLLGLFLYMTRSTEKTSYSHVVSQLSLQAEIGRLRKKLWHCGKQRSYSNVSSFEPIFVITPTHSRPVQEAELTRLSNVLVMVPNIHWIVVEDSPVKTDLGKTPKSRV